MNAFLAAADALLCAVEPTSVDLDELCDELFRAHSREEIELWVAVELARDVLPQRRRGRR